MGTQKIISMTVFNITDNQMFLEQQISILY